MNLNRPLQKLLWLGALACIGITALRVYQIDLWWQLPEGLSILRTGQLPTQPPAAFGLPAPHYFDEYGGYEIVIALIYRAAGFLGLWIFFAGVYLAIFALPILLGPRRVRDFSAFSTGLLVLALIFLANRFEQRPELVGLLFLVVLLALLRNSSLPYLDGKRIAALALLFCLWSNTHDSVMIGGGALGLWLAGGISSAPRANRARAWRQSLAAGSAAALGVALNPYGFTRFLFPIWQESDPSSSYLSPEMGPVTQQAPAVAWLLGLATLALGVVLLTSRRPPLWLSVFALLTLGLSVWQYRHIGLLGVSLLFLHAERQRTEPVESRGMARALGLGVLCVALIFFDLSWAARIRDQLARESSFGRLDVVFAPRLVEEMTNDLDPGTPVLCQYDVGAYMTFAGKGRLRPLLDTGLGRFSNDTKRYYYLIEHDPRAFSLALEHLHIHHIVVTLPVQWWAQILATTPGWHHGSGDSSLWTLSKSIVLPNDLDREGRTLSPSPSTTAPAWADSNSIETFIPLFSNQLNARIDSP